VPSLTFTTGAHTDYHKPSDTPDKIDYEDLDRVAGSASAIVQRTDGARSAAGVHQGRTIDADDQSRATCA
jgi:hypothetical protein